MTRYCRSPSDVLTPRENLLLCLQGTRRFLAFNSSNKHYTPCTTWDGIAFSVCITSCYGLDGPGIESRWRFSAPIQTGPGSHPASKTMGTGSFPGVKRPGRGVDHPPPSSTEVKGRLKQYIYFFLWAFVDCSSVNFTFNVYPFTPCTKQILFTLLP